MATPDPLGEDSGTLSTRSRFRSVGRNVRKVDSLKKVTGVARYETDIEGEDLLHAAVVRSPLPHARIASIDTASAEAMSGVEEVVRRDEFLGLFDDRIRHYGDAIAAVAATDRPTAMKAVSAVEYQLEELDAVFDPEAALEESAPTIHPDNPEFKQHGRHPISIENDAYRKNVDDYHALTIGDVDGAFRDSSIVFEGEYRTPRVSHCNLATHCCIADWDGRQLTLTGTLSSPGRTQEELADFLGLARESVEIRVPDTVTSSFGGKSLRKLSLEPIAATLAVETACPVKLWFDREEEFVATATRHHTVYRLKTGVDSDGRIVAVDMRVVADTGAYPNGVGHIVLTNSRDRPFDLYRIRNFRFEGVSVFTNNIPAGEYRGIGSTQLCFAFESHLDELSREFDLDPDELRRSNFVEEGYVRAHTGRPIESCGVEECLDRGRDRFERLRRGPTDDPAKRWGWGFAPGTHTTASGSSGTDSSETRLRLFETGRIVADTASIDNGQGSDTVMAQIIREELGVPANDVEIRRFPTTDDLDDVLGAVASRSTYIIGAAVRDAAGRMAAELVERASARFGVPASEISLDAGRATANGSSLPIGELVGDNGPITVVGDAVSDLNPPSYGVHFAEVEIDVGTGSVDVLTYLAAQDVGFAIHPRMVEGQLEGAVQHGVEFALYSEVKLAEGRPENATLADYPVVSPLEMPERLACEIIESEEPSGPYGAKGIGTPSMPPVAPAILNAVRDATGHRFRDPPADCETVFAAIEGE